MPIDLDALADQVNDEESFLKFLSALAADWEEERGIETKNPSGPYSSGALGWEHGDIGGMLGAAAEWGTQSINGLQFYEKPVNPWRRAAHILHAGKFYE